MLKSTISKMIFAAVFLSSLSAFAQAAAHHNDLTWQAGTCPASTVCGATAGFNVKRGTASGGPYTTIQAVSPTTLNLSDSSGLVEGQHRFYVITATGPGGESAPSNELDLTTPFSSPATPAALSGSAH